MSSNTSYRRRHRHSHSEDTKKEVILKYFFSFITFVMLTVLSFLICARSVFFSPVFLEKSFTNYEYTMELYENIEDYAVSCCKSSNIDSYAVEKAITFETVKELNDAYISEKLKTDGKFNEETYDYFISDLKTTLQSLLEEQMEVSSVEINDAADKGIENMIEDITAYINRAVSVSHAEDIYSFIRVADIVLMIAAVVAAVITGAFAVIVCYIGEKRYRGIRYAAYSVGGSALINMVFAVILNAYSDSMKFTLYPNYLQFALENHINNAILALICASVSLFAVFVILLAVCWKLKRKNK